MRDFYHKKLVWMVDETLSLKAQKKNKTSFCHTITADSTGAAGVKACRWQVSSYTFNTVR
jgi:hypothetical protein